MGDFGNEIKDIAGYAASAFVLTTFMMTSFRWLRVSAIISNVAFILYALLAGLPPILVLHSILLPLNVYRLAQLERVRRVPAYASTSACVSRGDQTSVA